MSAAPSKLAFPALALLAVFAVWHVFEGFRAPAPGEAEGWVERPRYHLEGAHWRRYDDNGKPVFEADVAGIDYFDDASMHLVDVELATLDGDSGRWRLTADQGTVPAGEKRIQLRPDVLIRGRPPQQQPTEIRTPTLWVNWSERVLDSEDPVVATSGGSRLRAVGLHADWAAERVEFLDQVEVLHAPQR